MAIAPSFSNIVHYCVFLYPRGGFALHGRLSTFVITDSTATGKSILTRDHDYPITKSLLSKNTICAEKSLRTAFFYVLDLTVNIINQT